MTDDETQAHLLGDPNGPARDICTGCGERWPCSTARALALCGHGVAGGCEGCLADQLAAGYDELARERAGQRVQRLREVAALPARDADAELLRGALAEALRALDAMQELLEELTADRDPRSNVEDELRRQRMLSRRAPGLTKLVAEQQAELEQLRAENERLNTELLAAGLEAHYAENPHLAPSADDVARAVLEQEGRLPAELDELRAELEQLRAELQQAEDAALRNAEMLHGVMRGDQTLDLRAERDELRNLLEQGVCSVCDCAFGPSNFCHETYSGVGPCPCHAPWRRAHDEGPAAGSPPLPAP